MEGSNNKDEHNHSYLNIHKDQTLESTLAEAEVFDQSGHSSTSGDLSQANLYPKVMMHQQGQILLPPNWPRAIVDTRTVQAKELYILK
jgi:hypothetical protein